jgi:transcriptional regulator of arginine metabolism
MTKARRHNLILKLIRSRAVFTQAELAELLAGKGLEATQVTLSRDIHELGLVKTANGYQAVEQEPRGPRLADLAPETLLEARVAQNLLVLKTHAGHAMSLARSLDQEGWTEVIGTVAGDDTVLVVAPDFSTAKKLSDRLLGLIE